MIVCWLFMVMKKINKNQTELGIRTYDFNVPQDHISRFVADFVEECYPILGIKEKKKKQEKRRQTILSPMFNVKTTYLCKNRPYRKCQSH